MKKIFFKLLSLSILILIPINLARADNLSQKLSGQILLQVESHGEAWYVNPDNHQRYYMADGNAAFNVMRNLGIGITNDNLTKLQNNKNLAEKQSGKIFLQIQDKGEAYYVNSDGTLYYLKDGDAAYNIMRSLGLGITNSNLFRIPESVSGQSLSSSNNGPTNQDLSKIQSTSQQQNNVSQITADDMAPYLTGVVEVLCKKKDAFGVEEMNDTGSGSLWKLPDGGYNLVTNRHVVAGDDLCIIWIPNSSGTEMGTYQLNLSNYTGWNQIADESIIPISLPKANSSNVNEGIYDVPIKQLNYSISSLRYCPSSIPQGSPVITIGYPAFSSINNTNNQDLAFKNQIITNGIISGNDPSSESEGLPYSNYYISSTVDSGNSGGVVLSKDKDGLCLLGIPTWITLTGNYSNEGLVQNINNITWSNSSPVASWPGNDQICRNNYGENSVYSGQNNSSGGPTCDCAKGYQFNSDQTLCVPVPVLTGYQICATEYTGSTWDGTFRSGGKYNCVCSSGYTFNSAGTECISKLSYCQNLDGYWATYNSVTNSCTCISGYIYNGSQCISGINYCQNLEGYGASYNSVTNSCFCMSGYIFNGSQCVLGYQYSY
jgi:hypothetical protein